MLQYNVRDILADPRIVISVEETLTLDCISLGGETVAVTKAPVVRGKIRNLDGTILECSGNVELTVTMPCSRCLTEVEVPLSLDFSQRFVPAETAGEPNGDEDAEIFSEYRLELLEFIMNEIRLGIPMKVLCREDCKGLCPKCGRNLNEGFCGCDLHEKDPRWDALKSLLRDKNRD